MSENIKLGWMVYDIVAFTKEWCIFCAKSRLHEGYGKYKICLACGYNFEVLAEVKPQFQIERFIKENMDE